MSAQSELIKVYECLGYTELSKLAKYYESNENALKMLDKAISAAQKADFLGKEQILRHLFDSREVLCDEIYLQS